MECWSCRFLSGVVVPLILFVNVVCGAMNEQCAQTRIAERTFSNKESSTISSGPQNQINDVLVPVKKETLRKNVGMPVACSTKDIRGMVVQTFRSAFCERVMLLRGLLSRHEMLSPWTGCDRLAVRGNRSGKEVLQVFGLSRLVGIFSSILS